MKEEQFENMMDMNIQEFVNRYFKTVSDYVKEDEFCHDDITLHYGYLNDIANAMKYLHHHDSVIAEKIDREMYKYYYHLPSEPKTYKQEIIKTIKVLQLIWDKKCKGENYE